MHSRSALAHDLSQVDIEFRLSSDTWIAQVLSLGVGGRWPHEVVVPGLLWQRLTDLSARVLTAIAHSLLQLLRCVLVLHVVAER